MANQLGSPLVSPRTYSRHMRHRKLSRVKHDGQFEQFLNIEATRFAGGVTGTNIFTKLLKNTADQIRKAATYASLK